ncbi:nucleotidyl transferase AbiEii/AbiGii toxin family protein [uncultured Granulicatella sp.]|uniref:nucleotidyl transferase AbiEii/AbiGii toxin family protein n=1 Tax=uncultured Granulicatella sp. TaxID=316089 RepID=UPI0028D17548|nr:nucleotidyl transferase AbiEii/AbiGii toxin family protein [uncultured Granulicatella sp.]
MKTSEQIKGAIRNISKKTGVNANSLLQMCLFEGILEKISKSKYKNHFILKGGLLISSLIGVEMRSTLDMDTTIRGLPMNEENISKILQEILEIYIDADIVYRLVKLERIRIEDFYEDFSATISCRYGKINTNLNIDITTGDIITPNEVQYFYEKILEEGSISILTYTIETIIAEKFETISSRNITTTRARDFYDLYMLYNLYKSKIDKNILKEAITLTSQHRNSYSLVLQNKEIVKLFYQSDSLKNLWAKYVQNNSYAKDISFNDTISIYEEIGSILENN